MDKLLARSIGKTARAARVALGLTQEDAAERIGISVEFYSRIERGKALLSVKTLMSMAKVLRVSTDMLLGMGDANAAGAPSSGRVPDEQDERPEVRRVLRRVRKASIGALRFVNLFLKEMARPKHERTGGDEEE